jgi:twitching motility protein PilJ
MAKTFNDSKRNHNSRFAWFYNLPISRKQWIALLASELVAILGIGVVGTWIITKGLREQLIEQAKSEVAVADINYNIKLNQMSFGFRGQSDNLAIIRATITHNSGKPLSLSVKTAIKQILTNEIKARKIEYATLVDKDAKIIINANNDRQGEEFNPGNLVSQVLKNPKQIKANSIVSWSELSKESPLLPEGFRNQDALIRYTLTPVKDPNTQKVIGALIAGDIVNGKDVIVRETLKANGGGYNAVYLRKPTGEFALATSLNQTESGNFNQAKSNLELPAESKSLLSAAAKAEGKIVTQRMIVGEQTYTIAAKSIPNQIIEFENPLVVFDQKPVAILVRGTPETALNKLLNNSLLVEIATVFIGLLLIVFWAFILKRSIIEPIENLEQTAQKFTEGDRTSRASIFATDEVGNLAVAFNTMADRITEQSHRETEEAKLALQLNDITARVRETLDYEKILRIGVLKTREALKCDRLLFYCLDENWHGTIIAESADNSWSRILGTDVSGFYLTEEYSEDWEVGNVEAVADISQGSLSQYYLNQLHEFDVKAYLLAPVFTNNKPYGVIIAHQCSSQRNWQDAEINLFKQVAIQIGYALEQAELLQKIEQGRQSAETVSVEERQEKQALQLQLLKLLDDIEGAARGDLTVRADVSEGEIGTVADFFNSIVESLRLIVTKVKASAIQVNASLGSNKSAIGQLAAEALAQAAEINRTLDAVDKMTLSMKSVASSAQLAASVANRARSSASLSGEAMNLTVENILHLRETVGETTKKVKRLGESTQQISRVVSLINDIALQTNLLAINAGIEAARAGEEGQGFAIVAEEVGELAVRSASATQEIENILQNIKQETNEVVEAMEVGTSQVVEGTQIVENAKQSLNQILEVSRQMDCLVQSISTATMSQVETSQTVSVLMKAIAQISQRTSDSSLEVSQSLQQTVEISQELQETVEMFKVG